MRSPLSPKLFYKYNALPDAVTLDYSATGVKSVATVGFGLALHCRI